MNSARRGHQGRFYSGPSKPRTTAPRPTHFLCFPLSEHTSLHQKISAFQAALLQGQVDGLDRSICVQPIRMHLTIGVMTLDSRSKDSDSQNTRTVADALALLQSLKDDVNAILTQDLPCLQVKLERLGIFMERGRLKKARVLWIGPNEETEDEDTRRLKAAAGIVLKAFRDAGFVTETRPLTLHCTLLNTTYRKPRPAKPFGFSLEDIMACGEAMNLIDAVAHTSMTLLAEGSKMDISLGTWPISSIDLCIMGSKGPNGEYISCGGIKLEHGVDAGSS